MDLWPQALGANPALIFWMVAISVLKDFAKIPLSIPVVNTVLGIDTSPAFVLQNAETAIAEFFASLLYW